MKKIIRITLLIIILILIILPISISISNNKIAKDTEKELKEIPLPSNTELVDSISIAGKLTGNGNGMQYFGGILIETELNEENIKKYYQNYKKDEWSCLIKKQNSNKIDVIEHGDYEFKNMKKDETSKYYIIYSWGSSKNEFLDFDLRGH